MTFTEQFNANQLELGIIVAADRGLKWEFLTEDSQARIKDAIRNAATALDGGCEQFFGIEADAAEELRKLRAARTSQRVKVQVEAPSIEEVAPKPTRRGK